MNMEKDEKFQSFFNITCLMKYVIKQMIKH